MDETHLRTAKNALGALVVVLVVALVVVLAVPQAIGAQASYTVLSGSMEPTISAGDLVVVRDVEASQIEEGDIVVYTDGGERITHRVVEVRETASGEHRFVTKGDANEEPDPGVVRPSEVVGRVWFHLPLVGHLALFGQSRLGTVALVVVPGILLVVSELYDLLGGAESRGDGGNSEPDAGDSRGDD